MMKKIAMLSLAACAMLWMGCPVGLDYSLGEPGSEKVDKDIIGIWNNGNAEEAVQKVQISMEDAHSYRVEVLEKGELYALETTELTGYFTELDGAKFIYLKPDGEEKFYHYSYLLNGNDELVSVDMSLLDGGTDAVTSTKSLRKQVSSSMKMDEWGKEPLTWNREE